MWEEKSRRMHHGTFIGVESGKSRNAADAKSERVWYLTDHVLLGGGGGFGLVGGCGWGGVLGGGGGGGLWGGVGVLWVWGGGVGFVFFFWWGGGGLGVGGLG